MKYQFDQIVHTSLCIKQYQSSPILQSDDNNSITTISLRHQAEFSYMLMLGKDIHIFTMLKKKD